MCSSATSPTLKLLDYSLALKRGKDPDPEFVELCIRNGAKLCYWYPRLRATVLHLLLQDASATCVAAALKTDNPVDFTALCGCSSRLLSPLHLVAARPEKEEATEILRLIIDRSQSHPNDKIDFSQKTWNGLDLLSLSALHRRLSLFWPHLKHLPLFSPDKAPFRITVHVCWRDWNALPHEERALFRLMKGIECNQESTVKLHQLCLRETECDSEEVLECIREGADVCSPIREARNLLVLQILLRKGWMKCFGACLETENMIVFRDYFCTLFGELQPINIEKVLRLILHRVSRHPAEEFSWELFLNSIVVYNALSLWWPHLKSTPYFMDVRGPFPITNPMHWKDWCAIPLEDRPRFMLVNGVEWSTESTLKLQELFAGADNVDRKEAITYLREGGDIQAKSKTGTRTLLEVAFSKEEPSFVIELLENIYFFDEDRLFYALCLHPEPIEMLRSLISYFLTQSFPPAKWRNIIPIAAFFGLLYCFWNELKQFSHFLAEEQTYEVPEVWKFDWDQLVDAHQEKHFSLQCSKMVNGNESTANLFRFLRGDSQDPFIVEQCVEKGADLCFHHPLLDSTLLHVIFKKKTKECFRAALKSPDPIDFTLVDGSGWTLLQAICTISDTTTAKEFLEILIERLELNPEDIIDFTQTTRKGFDFLALAARHTKLSVFWPVIREFPYFSDKIAPIPIKGGISPEDWDALSSTDKERFIPPTPVFP